MKYFILTCLTYFDEYGDSWTHEIIKVFTEKDKAEKLRDLKQAEESTFEKHYSVEEEVEGE